MQWNVLKGASAAACVLVACAGEQAAAPDAYHPAPSPAPLAAPVHETGSGSVTAHVGVGGGILELSEGPRVVLPAGAVPAPTDFVLQTSTPTTAFLNLESERPVGPVFAFSPALVPEEGLISVSLPLSTMPEGWGEPALAYEYAVGDRVGAEDSQHTRWQYEDASYRNGRIEAEVDALTGLRLQFVLTNLQVQ